MEVTGFTFNSLTAIVLPSSAAAPSPTAAAAVVTSSFQLLLLQLSCLFNFLIFFFPLDLVAILRPSSFVLLNPFSLLYPSLSL